MKRIHIDDDDLSRIARALIDSGYIRDEDTDNEKGIKRALREILDELNSRERPSKAA